MRSSPWIAASLAVWLSCGDPSPPLQPPPPPPMMTEFGLDVRPANPTCTARPRPPLDTGVALQRMWTGVTFQAPIYMTQAPGDNDRWYILQRGTNSAPGRVRSLPTSATSNAEVREVVAVPVNATGEGGMLGMAFHPRWPGTPEVYLAYTRSVVAGDPQPVCQSQMTSVFTSVVSRFRSNNGMTLEPTPDEILKVGQPFTNHNGGTIQFGNDNLLYLGLGDGGSGNDPCEAAQNRRSLLGKMLRIDVDAPAGMYRVPGDNPFVNDATYLPEIWSLGHRNPFRWSFDRTTGDLWMGDVGQGTWEEIDLVTRGGNYGWKTCEGFHRRGSTTQLCNTPGAIDPIVAHPRSEARSITGGAVYRGSTVPRLAGRYVYGDFETGTIWAIDYEPTHKATPEVIAQVVPDTLVAFGQGNDGELYTVQISGVISKLVASAPPATDSFPRLLSQTGCVDPGDPTRPAPGLIPYDVNSPLWSDGADKERYLAIPDGKTIAIAADGDWDLPIGSVAVKTFSVGGKRIETRLFMRHDDGDWAGYTYEWNADGSDATLLASSKTVALDGDAAWAYPSRSQCLQCHSAAAGSTLGLETAQLNRDGVYPSTNRIANQLATLDHIGMFAAPVDVAAAPKLAAPDGNEPIEARARAYLHANCAHCHRPDGGGQGTMDLRYTRSLRETATCDVANTQGPIGDATRLIAPGSPGASILSLRVRANDAKRMPPVAVRVEDALGADLIDDWITSLTACP